MFSEFRTEKNTSFTVLSELGTKHNSFTVFSELGTNKALVLQCVPFCLRSFVQTVVVTKMQKQVVQILPQGATNQDLVHRGCSSHCFCRRHC